MFTLEPLEDWRHRTARDGWFVVLSSIGDWLMIRLATREDRIVSRISELETTDKFFWVAKVPSQSIPQDGPRFEAPHPEHPEWLVCLARFGNSHPHLSLHKEQNGRASYVMIREPPEAISKLYYRIYRRFSELGPVRTIPFEIGEHEKERQVVLAEALQVFEGSRA